MISDEQIKVASDWWADVLSRNHEDAREAFREELTKLLQARVEGYKNQGSIGVGLGVLLDSDFDLEGLLGEAMKAAGITCKLNKALPEEVHMTLEANGRVRVRMFQGGFRKEMVQDLLPARTS